VVASPRQVLALTALSLLSASAQAQAPAPAQALAPLQPATIAQGVALASEAARVLAPAGARLAVEVGTLDPRLTLAPCARVEPYLPAGMPAWGRTRLGLRCTDGRARWNVYLPLTVQVLAPAVVAAAALPAGVPLTEAHLKRVDVDWSTSTSPLFDQVQTVLGRSLSRPLVAGQPVQSAQLLARQWFAPGDTVRIQASGVGFSIAGEGQALGPGLEGKSVRVQTENGRVLLGKPISDRCVEVVL
jgi:flagella basal body P-ring formation protein FlgA